MIPMSNEIAHDNNYRMNAVSLRENRFGTVGRTNGLRGVKIALANNPSEICPAADLSFDRRHEIFVERRVVAAYPAAESVSVIIPEPGLYDVVRLVSAEAHEVI